MPFQITTICENKTESKQFNPTKNINVRNKPRPLAQVRYLWFMISVAAGMNINVDVVLIFNGPWNKPQCK